jgi:hypothetical protein
MSHISIGQLFKINNYKPTRFDMLLDSLYLK